MKISVDENEAYETEELIIKCPRMTDRILRVIDVAREDERLIGKDERGVLHVIEPAEAFYFESVDDRVFIYTAQAVLESGLKLYEAEKSFGGIGFLRVSKSVVINLKRVKTLTPLFNGKIEVEFENGEKQLISRQYAPELKKKLGIGR